MSKRDDYLMSDDLERKIMDGLAAQSLVSLSIAPSTNEKLSTDEKLRYKNNTIIASSLLCFVDEESMLKDWKGVDWEYATLAPEMIAFSGNETAIRNAPIDWATLKTPQTPHLHQSNETYKYDYPEKNEEYFFLVQKMIIGRTEPFSTFSTTREFSNISFRNNNIFWNTLVKDKKLSAQTPLSSSHYKNWGALTLFDLALLYCQDHLLDSLLPTFNPSPAEAEKTLITTIFRENKGPKLLSKGKKIVDLCLKANPNLLAPAVIPIHQSSSSFVDFDRNFNEFSEDEEGYFNLNTLSFRQKKIKENPPLCLLLLASQMDRENASGVFQNALELSLNTIKRVPSAAKIDYLKELAGQMNINALEENTKSFSDKSIFIKTLKKFSVAEQEVFMECLLLSELSKNRQYSKSLSSSLRAFNSLSKIIAPPKPSKEKFEKLVKACIREMKNKNNQNLKKVVDEIVPLRGVFDHNAFDDLIDTLKAENPQKIEILMSLMVEDLEKGVTRPNLPSKKM